MSSLKGHSHYTDNNKILRVYAVLLVTKECIGIGKSIIPGSVSSTP